MQRLKKWLLAALPCLFLMISSVTIVSATGSTAASNTKDQILSAVTDVYTLLRSIVVPFMILSIGRSGLELLYAAFTSRHGQAIDDIKKQAITMVFACAFMLGLPTYVSWAASLAEPHAWESQAPAAMQGPGLDHYVDYLEENYYSPNDTWSYEEGFDDFGSSEDFEGNFEYADENLDEYVSDDVPINLSIARAAVLYAYTNFEDSKSDKGTPLYQYIHDRVLVADPNDSNRPVWKKAVTADGVDRYYMACDRSVVCAILWAGADDEIPWGDPVIMHNYFLNHSSENQNVPESDWQWELVYRWNTWDSRKIDELLRPGDLLVSPSSDNEHILMYVGNELIREIHGDAAIDALPNGSKLNCVEGSLNSRSPGLVPYWYGNEYHVWRCIKADESSIHVNAHEGYSGPLPGS